MGAGSAATGIADLLVCALVKAGLSIEGARGRCWFVDLAGLVVKGREGLEPHNLPYAHDGEFLPDLLSAVNALEPTALIGATGQPGTFTRPALEAMARINERPIIFALSNPTSRSEATAECAYEWTEGRAVFASGSPFAPVTYGGRLYVPGQSNNVYIFPGVGLGVVASGAERVTEDMFLIAAETLAGQVTQESLDRGSIFPPLRVIRDVSASIAVAVSRVALSSKLTSLPLPQDLAAHIRSLMYQPDY